MSVVCEGYLRMEKRMPNPLLDNLSHGKVHHQFMMLFLKTKTDDRSKSYWMDRNLGNGTGSTGKSIRDWIAFGMHKQVNLVSTLTIVSRRQETGVDIT